MTWGGIYGSVYVALSAPRMSWTWQNKPQVGHIKAGQNNKWEHWGWAEKRFFSCKSPEKSLKVFLILRTLFILTSQWVAACSSSMPNGWLLQLRWFYNMKVSDSSSKLERKTTFNFSCCHIRKDETWISAGCYPELMQGQNNSRFSPLEII